MNVREIEITVRVALVSKDYYTEDDYALAAVQSVLSDGFPRKNNHGDTIAFVEAKLPGEDTELEWI